MITSPHNERLKDIRRLRRSKGDRALLEGPHLVTEALAAGVELESVFATPEFLATPAGRALSARLAAPPLEVAERALASIADADSPRGLAAVARLPRCGVEALPVRGGGVYLYADGLQDPGNLGALARVAEAAGAAGLALAPGAAHPNHPRALRASAGSLLRLPTAVGVEPAALDRRLEPAGTPHWVALAARGGRSLWDQGWASAGAPAGGSGAAPPPPLVLAVGAEGPGLSAAAGARADDTVTIPLAPPVESLNATAAAALVLFELRRRAR